jgi:hypothetical protein
MRAYFNYPNSKVTIHIHDGCSQIMKQSKLDRRFIRVRIDNLVTVLERIETGEINFRSEPEANDLWLDIDLQSQNYETSFVHLVHALLSDKYLPFRKSTVEFHDCV